MRGEMIRTALLSSPAPGPRLTRRARMKARMRRERNKEGQGPKMRMRRMMRTLQLRTHGLPMNRPWTKAQVVMGDLGQGRGAKGRATRLIRPGTFGSQRSDPGLTQGSSARRASPRRRLMRCVPYCSSKNLSMWLSGIALTA
jgi:hypothetical protein